MRGIHQQMVLAGALMVGLALGGFSTPPVAKSTRLQREEKRLLRLF